MSLSPFHFTLTVTLHFGLHLPSSTALIASAPVTNQASYKALDFPSLCHRLLIILYVLPALHLLPLFDPACSTMYLSRPLNKSLHMDPLASRLSLPVILELEVMEMQIHELLDRQAKLREWRAALESSRVSIQRDTNTPTTPTPCASLHRSRAPRAQSFQVSFTPVPGHHGPWVQQQRKIQARPRARTSPPPPPPVFEIHPRNRFAPLRETERDTVIVGDTIVWYVCATLAKGKVHTHCYFGTHVLNVSVQIPAILKDDESEREQ
ncbi:Unconventional myosin-If [Labeo rohita]|uniref:Unconventional myosin-If n=1 Tax=Labeo rohita TaxID=84645 RepID=A0ABQ8L9M2_LABRO|nr:Unconventional myosin-If [Labeo rohita]